jgi:hypothetical protein
MNNTHKQKTNVIIFAFLVLTVLTADSLFSQQSSQEAGLDLFIRACQNSGWNTNLISSVRLEFEEREWDAFYAVPDSYTPEELEQMLPAYHGDKKARDELLQRQVYKIDCSLLSLNDNIADDVFSLNIPERQGIDDRRHAPHRLYLSTNVGVLSLKEGGLDLDKMDWLQNLENPLNKVITNNHFLQLRVFFAIFGAVPVLLILSRLWKKRRNSKTL